MFNIPAVNYRGKIDNTYSSNSGTKFEDGANQSVLPCKRTPVYQFCTPGYQLPFFFTHSGMAMLWLYLGGGFSWLARALTPTLALIPI
jgi:hypothetical protein